MLSLTEPKRVLIIGGGPAGLVTLRNLLERGNFDRVELVERRDDVGGVWYMHDTDPSKQDAKPQWPSPAYPGLIGNVLPEFLSFSGCPFPSPPSSPQQPFPDLVQTYDYLQAFAEPYLKQGQIRLNIEVTRVEELLENKGWKVTFNDWNDEEGDQQKEDVWDAVVCSVGWYDNPVWPTTEGLSELKGRGLAMHAKWWTGAEGYEGKRILIIGNANSSNDMAAQLAPVAQTPVYRSIRRPAFPGFPSLPDEKILDVSPVRRYEVNSAANKITATLEDGTVLSSIDLILVGTGYRPHPGFIRVLKQSNTGEPDSQELEPLMQPDIHPYRIPHLHQHILYAYNPSLAFIGMTMAFTPFIIADVTSTWLALAWSNLISYPPTPTSRLEFEKKRIQDIAKMRGEVDGDTGESGDGPIPSSLIAYPVLGVVEEVYATELRNDIVKAKPEMDSVLPLWTEDRKKVREAMYPLKKKALEWAKARLESNRVA